jgi:hypothetical protein
MRGVIPALANTVGGMGFPVQGKDFQQGVVIGMINGQARRRLPTSKPRPGP